MDSAAASPQPTHSPGAESESRSLDSLFRERRVMLTNSPADRSPGARSPVRSPVPPPVLSRTNSHELVYGGQSFPPIQNSQAQYPAYYPPPPPHSYERMHGRYPEDPEAYPGPAGSSAVEIYQQRWEENQRGMYEQPPRPEYREGYYQERVEGAASSGSVSPTEEQAASEANRSPNGGYFYMAQSHSNQGQQDVFERGQPSPSLPLYYNYGPTAAQPQYAEAAYPSQQYAQYNYPPAVPIHPTPAPSYDPVSRSGSLSDASSNTKGKAKAVVNPDDRPFACDECDHAFHRNHDLKRHKRIHLEVKPFPCNWCEKRFTRKDALKRHLLVKQHPVTQEDRDKEAKKQANKANNKKLKRTAESLRVQGQTPATIRREIKLLRDNPPPATPPRSPSPANHGGQYSQQISPHAQLNPNAGIPLRAYAPRDPNLLSPTQQENGSHENAYFPEQNGRYEQAPQHHQQAQGNFQPFAVAFV